MKKIRKFIIVPIMFALLLGVIAGPAALAEGAGQPVNILLLVAEGSGNAGYVIQPMILTLDLTANQMRIVNFYYLTQIGAVTRSGEPLTLPMTFLTCCEPAEIVRAFENTFGITLDRYVIYGYGSYRFLNEAFSLLCPLTLEIPEEWMGNAEYTTFNGNMKRIAKTMQMEYAPVTQPGPQAIGPVGLVAYYATIPDRIWASGDRFTMTMEDYKYWDAKNAAVLEALRPVIAQMEPDTVRRIWELMTGGQETNVTAEDIAAWSAIPFALPDEGYYFTVPGFEGVEMQSFNAGALTGVSGYDAIMFSYDPNATAEALQAFLAGP